VPLESAKVGAERYLVEGGPMETDCGEKIYSAAGPIWYALW